MQPRIWKDVKLAAMRRAQLLVSVFVNAWHVKINLCFGRTLITNFFHSIRSSFIIIIIIICATCKDISISSFDEFSRCVFVAKAFAADMASDGE